MTSLKDPGPWLPHTTGKMPEGLTRDDLVEVRLHDAPRNDARHADGWKWFLTGGAFDITHYRTEASNTRVYPVEVPSKVSLDEAAQKAGFGGYGEMDLNAKFIGGIGGSIHAHALTLDQLHPERRAHPLTDKAREILGQGPTRTLHDDEVNAVAEKLAEYRKEWSEEG